MNKSSRDVLAASLLALSLVSASVVGVVFAVNSVSVPQASSSGVSLVAPVSPTAVSERVVSSSPPSSVSGAEASRVVRAQVPGRVLGVSSARHAGVDAWMVTERASDSSLVKAWVDKASGVVFDWQVSRPSSMQAAYAPSREHSDESGKDSDD